MGAQNNMRMNKLGNSDLIVSAVGAGTWAMGGDFFGAIEDKKCIDSLCASLDHGVNLIDTAPIYGKGHSEQLVGQAIKGRRDKVVLCTKVGLIFGDPKGRQGNCLQADAIEWEIEQSLRRLGTDYIDLLLIHQPAGDYVAGYRLMEKAYKEGKVRAIGLSNFTKEQIEEILSICEVKPAVLQTELHPYHQEPELKAFLKKNGIVSQAWYPLGHGDKALLQEPLFAQLGAKYGKSAPQIILRWHIQSGNIVIPGSKNPEHIKSNFDLFDFTLTGEEMAQITAFNKNVRYYTSTPEMLKKYAEMVPPVDEQK